MRKTIITLIFLTLIGCTGNGLKSDSQNDGLKPKEVQSTNTNYQEYLGEKLNPIREKLRPLSAIQEWTEIDKRKIETENGNGAAEYYYLLGQLRKIRLTQNTPTTIRFVEYYIDNDTLFFVFEKLTDNLELKKNPEYYEPYEDSLFFENGELIIIKSNMDCGAPWAEDYRMEEKVRLQTEFDKLLKRL